MRSTILRFFAGASFLALGALPGVFFLGSVLVPFVSNAEASDEDKPTIMLVHGAFADSSSWRDVASRLLAEGYPVLAASNPLRSVTHDASQVADLIDSIAGPVILVGHSYGGMVITQAAHGKKNVKALVYVAGFAPDVGESAFTLSEKFPGSTLGSALARPVSLSDGDSDLYIDQAKFAVQFAADLPIGDARLMAATQRPVTDSALNEPASVAAWKTIPTWFIYGSGDKNIPSAAEAFMAQRARAKKVVEIKRASHALMVSHPDALVQLIEDATAATCSPN
jgi:pimeloyl-ACP methyl ester carboxylesterase